MQDKNNNDKKPNIADVLKEALTETESQLTKVYTKNEKPELKEPPVKKIADEKTADEKPKKEADEIIWKYSQKKIMDTDPRSSTAGLRESLDSHMQNDADLLNYYKGDSSRKRSKKVEELYTIIYSATQDDLKTRKEITDASNHFGDEEDIKKPAVYKQQKIYEFDETADIDLSAPEDTLTSFDEDYEMLSEKIERGEIIFEDDSEENENQIAIIDETIIPQGDIPLDKQDINLRIAFGMMDETSEIPEDLKEIYDNAKDIDKRNKKTADKEKPVYEYVNHEQNGDISEIMIRAIKKSLSRCILVFILMFAIIYLEISTPDSPFHPEYLRPGSGRWYVWVDLQLLFFIVLAMFENIYKGFSGLFKRKPTSETIMSCFVLFSAVYCLIVAIKDPLMAASQLYCSPAAFSAFCCAAVKYQQCKKDYHCFKTISSKKTKFVASKLENTAKEADEFYKYLLDDSELYTAKKASFVDGFFGRTQKRPEGEDLFGFIAIMVMAAAFVLLGVQIYLGKTFMTAANSFIRITMFALPVSSFFVISLPVIAANKIGKKHGSAFIGNAVGEEYADASVISFADTEVYPANLVKIKSIKVYGKNRIDKTAIDLARVFSLLGGPLKTVTANMVPGTDLHVENARLIESAADGVCVILDGREMFLGKKSYMRRYKFASPYDEGDEAFESYDGSIMFVTLNDELVAKIYVRYTLNSSINHLLRDMYKAGMCVGIKTLDPNINTELLERSVKFRKCPISILKENDFNNDEKEAEHMDSGIVTNASLHTFLRMFIVCDKIRHVTKSNAIINILSTVLAFFIITFLIFTGQEDAATSLNAVLFQLLWLIPVRIISYLL